LPVLWLLGVPLVDSALANRRRDAAAADLLIALGVAAAYVFSMISVWRGAGHVYFEVGCMVLVMVTLGRWLEATGKLRAMQAIDALEKLLPVVVRLRGADGRERMVAPEGLARGDLLRVLAGERAAVDAVVIAGAASLDEQLLTGESRPVWKQPGDSVLGGSLNVDGELVLEVSAPVWEGSLGRLIELVRRARLTKGRYQRLADSVAAWFLSGVIVVAVGTVLFHAWRSGADAGILAGLTVLLIACPCALGLATPLAAWTALAAASRRGVLFRHTEALERLAAVRAVRFDKTGTLSTAAPQVADLLVAEESQRGEVARRAARLAAASMHVFSRAIAEFLAPAEDSRASDVASAAGSGVFASFDGESAATRLGSLRWLEEVGLELPPGLARAIARCDGQSMSAIGWAGRVRAVFVFRETLRPEAAAALAECRSLGCDVAVLTGDEAARAATLADTLAVPVLAALTPEDKVAALDDARRRFGPVAMVGDGVNDAPALVAGDVGIALGCGADLARESAAVCLVSDNLARVPWAIELARNSVRVMRQNLFWAFAYNTVGIALAAAGWLNPAWAAAAMVASSVFVVTNSLRLGGAAPLERAAPQQIAVPDEAAGDAAAMPAVTGVP
jgi:heavy metal translocating P-type ATPase